MIRSCNLRALCKFKINGADLSYYLELERFLVPQQFFGTRTIIELQLIVTTIFNSTSNNMILFLTQMDHKPQSYQKGTKNLETASQQLLNHLKLSHKTYHSSLAK